MSQAAGAKLPKKEADLFKTLVTCYENKLYKKGIKTADTILKKFPNNGETQAMKGLLLNCMNQKEEAYELVKLGLRNDVRSHVCWHVYGLLYRSDNNYKEAIKCYLNALRIDSNNQNILRDLSWLQIQMRDFHGYVQSRRRILDGRPGLRASWVAFAVANYAVKEFAVASDVITKYNEAGIDRAEAYEEGEFLLFQNLCLEKGGKYIEAIAHLRANKAQIVDVLSWRIKLGHLLLLSKQFAEARDHWKTLLSEQPENYRFHAGLQAALLELEGTALTRALQLKRLALPCTTLTLSASQHTLLLDYYAQNAVAKSKAFEKIHLFLLQQDPARFEAALHAFIQKNVNDGVPSLCQDIMALAVQPDPLDATSSVYPSDAIEFRRHATVQTALRVVQQLLLPDVLSTLSPIAELWLHYLHAHLLWKTGDLSGATQAIEAAIAHTPTALDMYSFKAKLLKAQGDFPSAAECMDQCRALDLQDRYLNNKATKYFLRNDDVDSAFNTIALFTKHDADGDIQKTLYDLQVAWYELEVADAYTRQHKWGPALKKFHAVRQHFLDQYDDLFDFHGYCIRKTTLRAYMDMLLVQDQSFGHKRYQRALRGALKIYLYLCDCPEDVDGLGHLSPADRKKERARIKKAKEQQEKKKEQQQQQQAKDKKDAGTSAGAEDGEDSKSSQKNSDPDPHGEALLHQKDFLAEAALWTNPLLNYAAPPVQGLEAGDLIDDCSCETLALVAEVHLRRGKYLKCLRALNAGLARDPLQGDLLVVLGKLAWKARAKKLGTSHALLAPLVKAEVTRHFRVVAQLWATSTGETDTSNTAASASNASNVQIDVVAFVQHYLSLLLLEGNVTVGGGHVGRAIAAVKLLQLVYKDNATELRAQLLRVVSNASLLTGYEVTYDKVAELIAQVQSVLGVPTSTPSSAASAAVTAEAGSAEEVLQTLLQRAQAKFPLGKLFVSAEERKARLLQRQHDQEQQTQQRGHQDA